MIFEILFAISLPLLGFRILPLFIFPRDRKKSKWTIGQYVSLWEEITLLIFHGLTLAYVCYSPQELISWDFFWGNVFAQDVRDVDGNVYTAKSYSYLIGYMVFYSVLGLLVYVPPVKRDSREMFIHHVSTVLLMFFAYQSDYTRISVWVLFINDICDLFLGISTIFYKYDHWMQTPMFALFLTAHTLLRVCLYPYKIYVSVSISCDHFTQTKHFIALACNLPLFLLNFYWLYKCLRICYNRLYLKQTNVDFRDATPTRKSNNDSPPPPPPKIDPSSLTDENGWIKVPNSPIRLKKRGRG